MKASDCQVMTKPANHQYARVKGSQEHEFIDLTGNCPYLYPHIWCDNPCMSPPEPRYLSSRPEEMATEDVMRELGIYYERPIEEEGYYHLKRPDFRFYIPGLDFQSLDDKNRNHSRYQNPMEVRREFVKDTTLPLHIVGSFNLTRPGQDEFFRQTATGSSLHDFGFEYEENPLGFKDKLRYFFTELLERGKKILKQASESIRKRADSTRSTVGNYPNPRTGNIVTHHDLVARASRREIFLCLVKTVGLVGPAITAIALNLATTGPFGES